MKKNQLVNFLKVTIMIEKNNIIHFLMEAWKQIGCEIIDKTAVKDFNQQFAHILLAYRKCSSKLNPACFRCVWLRYVFFFTSEKSSTLFTHQWVGLQRNKMLMNPCRIVWKVIKISQAQQALFQANRDALIGKSGADVNSLLNRSHQQPYSYACSIQSSICSPCCSSRRNAIWRFQPCWKPVIADPEAGTSFLLCLHIPY